MYQVANWVQDTFDYINDMEGGELDIDSNYILDAIKHALKPYRKKVFSHLVTLREKLNKK